MSVPHCFDDYSFVLQIHYFKFLPELGGDEGEGGWIEGEKAGVAQGRMQHQGRDGSGEAIFHTSVPAKGVCRSGPRMQAWGIRCQWYLDLWDGPQ